MDITSRIKRFMEHEQLTNSQFADKCRIPRPTLSQILNGRNKKISDELIGKLHESFPHLSILWLMFGEGDMISAENIKTSEPQFNNIRQNSYTQRSDSKENILSFDMDSNMIDFTAENITQPSFHQSEEPFGNFHKQTEQISDKKTYTHQITIQFIQKTSIQTQTHQYLQAYKEKRFKLLWSFTLTIAMKCLLLPSINA